MKSDWLNEFAKNKVYSQFGEDGIAAKLLELLPAQDHWCVEFGAWDGSYLSTTLHFREQGYSAVLIEGAIDTFGELSRLAQTETSTIAINSFVQPTGPQSLDSILAGTPIPNDFDFLTIDIDGADYHVWNGVTRYRPKVVCIECNPSFPSDVMFIQEPGQENQGSSMLATVMLANEKGYELVATLGGNAFFVDRIYFPRYGIVDNSLKSIREWHGSIYSVAQTYRGEILAYGAKGLIWIANELVNREFAVFPKLCTRLQTLSPKEKAAYLRLVKKRDRLLGL